MFPICDAFDDPTGKTGVLLCDSGGEASPEKRLDHCQGFNYISLTLEFVLVQILVT
jgi:hypothetical protein